MMDMRQLRYFVAIVEHGSFSRAAEILRVAQPALSLHVRNMEGELGTALLFRSPRGVEPTEAGQILLRHAHTILDQLTVAEEEIRGHKQDPSGEVRLGLPGTISQILSVPLISAVHMRYPRIRLRIADAMSGFVLEWMRDGKIDLAVLYGETTFASIKTELLLEEELSFFTGPSGRQSLELPAGADIPYAQVAGMPLILPGQGHGLRDLLKRQASGIGAELNAAIEVDSYANIKLLAEEGLGCSVLPQNAIAEEVAEGRLLRWHIVEPEIRRGVYLAQSAERPLTNAVSAVLRLAHETLTDLVQTNRWVGARLPAGTRRSGSARPTG